MIYSVGNWEDGRRSGNRMMFTPVTVDQPTATLWCTPDPDITFYMILHIVQIQMMPAVITR
ncbi:MAG: hypothetical protein IPG00_03065 [Saprospiraceae bacterium]|nr:hypothetical protein [Saprospiraceae bacterium]